ncbi:endolytic transglycosylase MltG [Candidatus Wolfebacteria bacterium]|nr:endolytic transglycosylase MltG [Candidatus Wolfebacteria bacterium]
MKKSIAWLIGVVFFSAIFSGVLILKANQKKILGESAGKIFEIAPKTGFSEIAEKLAEEKIISSAAVFKIYGAIAGRAHRLKPGRYVFSGEISAAEVLDILIAGPKDIAVTIVPGATLSEIDEQLSSLAIIKAGGIINFNVAEAKKTHPWLESEVNSLEGFLLPDTYFFMMDSDPGDVVNKVLINFEKKALTLFNNGVNLEKLISASLLEKEIPDYEERRLVAGILEKRLASGMPLQVDATVIYAKCGKFLNCPPLNKKDYLIDSPYNSYLYKGWPPAPIANPSVSAIKAALQPKKSSYWYYLSDPKTKKTIFADTLDKHNQNKAIYLK